MKKLLSLLLIVSTFSMFGQNTIWFTDPNATWNVASTYPHANPQNPNFVETTTKVFGYLGDTLIGSEYWSKMYMSPDSNFQSDLIFIGTVREINGVVLFNDTTSIIDTIYNFNLNIGDSVAYNFDFGEYYLKIENIDSIEINGEYYKRFYFQEPGLGFFYLNEVWIEEIGSIHGPLFPNNPRVFQTEIPDSIYLTCYKSNDVVIWNNPNYENCYINIVLSTNELKDEPINVFPNPFFDKLLIEFPGNEKGEHDISVFDVYGNLIIKTTMNQNRHFEINLSFLENSIYIIQIESDKKVFRQKIIKQ
jgi:Secretion system C-terminal sorting domain